MPTVIGIDLGTTYSCVAVCQDGKVEIIPNEVGKNTTPSHVAFDEDGVALFGEAAKHQVNIPPGNGIFDVKRLIGRRYNDPELQKVIKNWPFKVIEGNDNTPLIQLPNKKTFLPEQISAKILSHLKLQAENQLGEKVTQAVITVPAYFNDGQRQATKDAGEIAGLEVLRIINEPTAAAIAYNFQRKNTDLRTVLVFDLGGGTFDVSILKMEGNDINVLGVGGDTLLGGEDFDNGLVEHCLEEFKKKEGVDFKAGLNSTVERMKVNKCLRRLKNECEKGKIHLSAAKSIDLRLDAFHGEKNLQLKITRETFNRICKDSFDKCMKTLEEVIQSAKLTKEEIDDVILVGGSSKIPEIQQRITEYFGKKPLQNIKGDEAVAFGAAIQATIMRPGKIPQKSVPNIKIRDVYPHSVGIQIHAEGPHEDNFSPIISRNTPIPCTQTKKYFTVYDNQTRVRIGISEGENSRVEDNHFLGEFNLVNLPKNCPKGEPINVTMEIDAEGILHCTATCPRSSSSGDIVVEETKGRLTNEEKLAMKFEEMGMSSFKTKPS